MKYSSKWVVILLFMILHHFNGFTQDKIPVEKCHQFLQGVPVNCMQSDDVNMLWVGTNLGLYIFNYFEGVRTILEEGAVTSLAQDGEGYMWCSLENGEVVRVDKKYRFKISDDKVDIRSMQIKGSHAWIGTASGGVYVWNINTLSEVAHYHKSNSELPSDEVNFVHLDDETLWIGTTEGLSKISGNDWSSILLSKNITAVANYANQLWFAGEGHLWTSNGSDDYERLKISRQLIRGEVVGMSFDDNGRLYMASDIFSRYDSEERTTFIYDSKFGFKERNLLCTGKDKDGDMWVGTADNGLFRFKVFFEDPPKEILFASIETVKNVECLGDKNGIVKVNAKGGVKPYSFQWSCDGCTGEKMEHLPVGTYDVTITDAEDAEMIVRTMVSSNSTLTLQVEKLKSISRNGARDGEIVIKAIGGKGRPSYEWNDNRRTTMRRALRKGEYEVTVSDQSGCSISKKFLIGDPRIIPELNPIMIEEGQIITMEQMFFDADSLNFNISSLPALEEVKEFLVSNPNVYIEIGGHTNGLPNHEYCDWLSTGRAKKVAEYFYSLGIAKDQVSFKGYGKRNNIASNDTKVGRNKNQRVEIKITRIVKSADGSSAFN